MRATRLRRCHGVTISSWYQEGRKLREDPRLGDDAARNGVRAINPWPQDLLVGRPRLSEYENLTIKPRLTRLGPRAVIARVSHWVANKDEDKKEAGAGERPQTKKRASAVKEKVEFGRGSGRSAGFYRQWIKKSDPQSEEAQEARKEARDQARADARRAEQAARDAKDQQQRQEQRREEQRREHAQHDGGRRDEGRNKAGAPHPVLDFDKMRRVSWHEYDRCFVAFRENALHAKAFQITDVPLPPKGQVIEPAISPEDWHKNLRSAQLRWHPDKWAKLEGLLSCASEREHLKQLTQGMFRAVYRAKERGFEHVRFPARSAGMWADPFPAA